MMTVTVLIPGCRQHSGCASLEHRGEEEQGPSPYPAPRPEPSLFAELPQFRWLCHGNVHAERGVHYVKLQIIL